MPLTTFILLSRLVLVRHIKNETFKNQMFRWMKLLTLNTMIYGCISTHIITLDPGTYVLSPCNYSYNFQLIIEMWGGGAAGNICNGYGGNSGGYMKFILNTKYHDINVIVGAGGEGTINSGDYCQSKAPYNQVKVDYPKNGSNTILTINNISISAMGGQWNGTRPINQTITNINDMGNEVQILINQCSKQGKLFGNNNIPVYYNGCGSDCCKEQCTYTCYTGGNSYGSSGGDPCVIGGYSGYHGTDGMTPGGGGGGNGLLPSCISYDGKIHGNCLACGYGFFPSHGAHGGHGRVIIYPGFIGS
jgi:hypothetical protein